MDSPSKSKANYSGPCFYDYINGLRDEFKLQTNPTSVKSSRPRRFNLYLEGLKCEFEILTEDIEILRKERDKLEVKVEAQAMELRNVRNNIVCQRCSQGTASTSRNYASFPLGMSETAPSFSSTPVVQSISLQKLNTPVSPANPFARIPRNIALSPFQTLDITPSRPVVQTKYFQRPNTASRVVNPSHQTPPSTQHMTLSRKSHSIITPPRSDPSVARSPSITLPSPQIPQATFDPDLGPEAPCWTPSNYGAGKGLHIDIAHVLYHRKAIWCVNFSQDGKYLAAGCQDRKTYIYDVQTGNLIRILRDLHAGKLEDFIGALCFSRDGKYLATGSMYKGIYVWEISTKYVRNAFKGQTGWIRFLDFSPDDRLLVSASENNTVQLWNMRDGAAKVLTDGNSKVVDPFYTSAAFSPDGAHVAASHSDGMVRVWHIRTGQLMRRVKAHMDIVLDVGFTPDGKGLMSGGGGGGGGDNTLKYWDISSWNATFIRARSQTGHLDRSISVLSEEQTRPEREYSGHSRSVNCLAISPDGKWVASGSFDKTVRIWDTRSGAVQCSLNHNDWVWSVDFSPAGQFVASGEIDGTVRIWRYSCPTPGAIRVHEW